MILFRISHNFYRKINASSPEVKTRPSEIKTLLVQKKPRAKNIQQCGYLNINQSKHVYVIYFFTVALIQAGPNSFPTVHEWLDMQFIAPSTLNW